MALLILLFLLIGAYSISKLILRDELKEIKYIPVHIVVGLLSMSILYVIKEKLGIGTWFIYLYAVIPVIVLLFTQKTNELVSYTKNTEGLKVVNWFIALVVIAATVVQVFIIAGGDFPSVIYNVDSAYFMQFVHGFVLEDQFPPEFRLSVNEGFNYHYATIAAAAMISEASGLAAHNSFLGVMPLLGIISLFILSGLVFEGAGIPKKYIYIAAGIFLFGYSQYLIPYWRPADAMRTLFGGVRFFDRFVQLPTLYGLNITLLTVAATQRLSSKRFQYLLVWCLFIIPFVKMPYSLALGLGVGLYILYYAYTTKNKLFLLIPVIGGLLMIVVYKLFVYNDVLSPAFSIKPLGLFEFNDLFTMGLFIVLVGLSAVLVGFKKAITLMPVKFYFFVLPFLGIASLIYFDHRDASQLADLVPFLMWLFIVVAMFKALLFTEVKWKKYAFIAMLLATSLPGFVVTAAYPVRVLLNPSTGHEYCNNVDMAEVLKDLPVEGTLIAINDTRYPADDYIRVDRQFQVSAIYGHKCFNAELFYSLEFVKNQEERRKLTELLQADEWLGESITSIVRKNHITHILIHKSYNHPEIPLEVVAENEEYALYKF